VFVGGTFRRRWCGDRWRIREHTLDDCIAGESDHSSNGECQQRVDETDLPAIDWFS
jgi:hypothetical protein